MKYFFSFLLLCFAGCAAVRAHPMPNTDIAIRLNESAAALEIRIPVPDLVLALPESVRARPDTILSDAGTRSLVEAYFKSHLNVLSESGVAQPYNITSITVSNNTDEFVGDYQELLLTVEVPARNGFNPRDFLLGYDAVIHQVPTHFALVKITQDFNNGVFAEDNAVTVGAIRYDFSSQSVPPLAVTAAAGGGVFKGFCGMVALGMNHILTGFDHILFLLTLLIVAPLAIKDRSWTLFRGGRYTMRRFLAISLAFTIGHSAALILGAYNVLSINQKLIEAAIAASIMLTALHAIRPVFSRREELVALGFGIVHGIAFSEVLTSLRLAPLQKAISIFGFNLGIELMQVIIMIVVFPFLLISRHKIYHILRVVFAFVAGIIACIWMVERVAGITALDIFKELVK